MNAVIDLAVVLGLSPRLTRALATVALADVDDLFAWVADHVDVLDYLAVVDRVPVDRLADLADLLRADLEAGAA